MTGPGAWFALLVDALLRQMARRADAVLSVLIQTVCAFCTDSDGSPRSSSCMPQRESSVPCGVAVQREKKSKIMPVDAWCNRAR